MKSVMKIETGSQHAEPPAQQSQCVRSRLIVEETLDRLQKRKRTAVVGFQFRREKSNS